MPAFAFPDDGRYALTWEDLLDAAPQRRALPATPRWRARRCSSSGTPAPRATACPRRRARRWRSSAPAASEVKVFAIEGEGGLTPGASHETRNTAWGLGLDNLVFLVDWNDFGIDDHADLLGGPRHARRLVRAVRLAGDGHRAGHRVGPDVTRTVLEASRGDNPEGVPSMRLVQDAQGPRLPQVRQQVPRRAAQDEQRAVLGRCASSSWRSTASSSKASEQPAPEEAAALRAQADAQSSRIAMGVLRATSRAGGLPHRPAASSWRARCPTRSPASSSAVSGADLFEDRDGSSTSATTRSRCGPSRARSSPTAPRWRAWGAWVNSLRAKRIRPAAVPGLLGRPRRLDQHLRLRQGLRRRRGLGLVRPREEPATARCCRRRSPSSPTPGSRSGAASVNLADDPMERVQRLLDRLLDLRLVLLPQVRPDAAVQPAGAGLRAARWAR